MRIFLTGILLLAAGFWVPAGAAAEDDDVYSRLIESKKNAVVQVKAEVDDGEVSKIKVGQRAFVRSINYPGRDFEGRIKELAPTMAVPRISARGPRRPTDIEVLEMTIELEGDVPLLPGMRVDAFVRPDR